MACMKQLYKANDNNDSGNSRKNNLTRDVTSNIVNCPKLYCPSSHCFYDFGGKLVGCWFLRGFKNSYFKFS
jgi:hypothetical protein